MAFRFSPTDDFHCLFKISRVSSKSCSSCSDTKLRCSQWLSINIFPVLLFFRWLLNYSFLSFVFLHFLSHMLLIDIFNYLLPNHNTWAKLAFLLISLLCLSVSHHDKYQSIIKTIMQLTLVLRHFLSLHSKHALHSSPFTIIPSTWIRFHILLIHLSFVFSSSFEIIQKLSFFPISTS